MFSADELGDLFTLGDDGALDGFTDTVDLFQVSFCQPSNLFQTPCCKAAAVRSSHHDSSASGTSMIGAYCRTVYVTRFREKGRLMLRTESSVEQVESVQKKPKLHRENVREKRVDRQDKKRAELGEKIYRRAHHR